MARRYAIGIDLGGTSIKYGICSDDGELLQSFKRPTRADLSSRLILQDLGDAAEEALAAAKEKQLLIEAIGMGTPGAVDVEKGYLMGSTPNFLHWHDVPIKQNLEAQLNLPVYADNDANLMAYGEYRCGEGSGFDNVLCITLGTGVGGGIIINRNIFRGSHYAGSEVGHMSIHYDGIPCRCGGIGCWEKYASATAFIDHYRTLCPDREIDGTREIFEQYQQGQDEAKIVVENGIKMIASGLASLVNIFNPQLIILGGGVSEAGDWFIEKIDQVVRQRAMKPPQKHLKIMGATLGNRAGTLGAALFALNELDSRS